MEGKCLEDVLPEKFHKALFEGRPQLSNKTTHSFHPVFFFSILV